MLFNQLIRITTFARICGVDQNSVRKRIKKGQISTVIIDGIQFIDTTKNQPTEWLKIFKNGKKTEKTSE